MSFLERLWYARNPGVLAGLAKLPLILPAMGFASAATLRSRLYDRGTLRAERIDGLRVISVGNLNVGGTGKTPATIFLANQLLRRGRRVAVLSRGYGRRETEERELLGAEPGGLAAGGEGQLGMGARAGLRELAEQLGDEPLLIHLRTGVPVFVGADRVSLARRAREWGADVALLDDGMQHRRLHRDTDVLVIDANAGFGNGWPLPLGPLREPPSAAKRAQLIWLRTDDPNAQPPPECAGIPVVRVSHRPASWVSPEGEAHPVSALAGKRVLAFAGLARPRGFLGSLEQLGAEVVSSELFPDHHFFSDGELASLEAHARAARAVLVTTEKDLMRLPAGHPASVLTQEVSVLNGADALARALG